MKNTLPICIFGTFLVIQCTATESSQNSLLDDVKDINAESRSLDDSVRIRRSGLTGLINKKLHFLGHLSGSSSGSSSHASTHVSGHSSGHHGDHHGGYEEHHDFGHYPGYEYHDEHKGHKALDFKKHILASLFQAVKAITGGVVALKGQVMKIGGHVLTWKGRFLVNKGESVSDFGRQVAAKALSSPVYHHEPVIIHTHPTSFGSSAYASAQASHSSGHANEAYHHGGHGHGVEHHQFVAPSYSAPSPTYASAPAEPSGGAGHYPYPSSAPEFDYSNNYGSKVTRTIAAHGQSGKGLSDEQQEHQLNEQLHAGLLILKPIQVPRDQPTKYQDLQQIQQSLIKQAGASGISAQTLNGLRGLNGLGLNTGFPTSSSSNNNYQDISPQNSYQGLNSYENTGASQFKLSTAYPNNPYRNSFPSSAPSQPDYKLPQETNPFDFLYKNQNKKSSQERQDTKVGDEINSNGNNNVNDNALSALNILYQQTGIQNKEQNRETRNTNEEPPLTDDKLKKILDALFANSNRSAKSLKSDSSKDLDGAGSENIELVNEPNIAVSQRRSDDGDMHPVYAIDYEV